MHVLGRLGYSGRNSQTRTLLDDLRRKTSSNTAKLLVLHFTDFVYCAHFCFHSWGGSLTSGQGRGTVDSTSQAQLTGLLRGPNSEAPIG